MFKYQEGYIYNHSQHHSFKTEDEIRSEVSTFFTIIRIGLFFLMFCLPIMGLRNVYVYANSYERSVQITGKESYSRGQNRPAGFHIRVKMTGKNFPAVSREAIQQARKAGPEKSIRVGTHFYDSVKSGDEINIEYAERGDKLYIRHADNHMPTWLYFLFSFLCFCGLMKMSPHKKP